MSSSPLSRRRFALGLGALAFAPPALAAPKKREPAGKSGDFAKFVDSIWPLAEKAGVSRETFDAAFHGVSYDPKIVANTEGQAEFVKPVWQYLASAVSTRRIEAGRAKYEEQRSWLDKAQRDFGVDAAVIMGIWGIETEFGAFCGGDYVIRALASLSLSDYQPEYFRSELVAALTILEDGDIEPKQMLGSWAGAMGQTQFMPSSYRKYAVDFDGDGKRDIWHSSADAIGSTANYLAEHGWKRSQPWGYEVALPEGFELTAADSNVSSSINAFARRGVTCADGRQLPLFGDGHLMILAGLAGPIFLVTENFATIKTYNDSTSYALAVALLGDAIVNATTLQSEWPVHDKQLTSSQVKELQTQLEKIGYDVGDIDGRPGDGFRATLRRYQEKVGEAPDGYATPALLKRISGAR